MTRKKKHEIGDDGGFHSEGMGLGGFVGVLSDVDMSWVAL